MLKTDKFDELLENAKEVKTTITKRKEHHKEDDFEDYFEDEYPPHYYGEDGEVLFGEHSDE